MKSYLLDTDRAEWPNGGSVFLGVESNYSVHRTGGDSFSIKAIVDFQ